MNQDKLEFYYQSKNIHSIQEKTAADTQQELEEKIAGNMRAVLSNFAAKHPKATESAITGGILGAGSELVMPANKDMYGNPSTNLGEIGKRALLGATLGGIGGELKTQVRSHVIPKIAQEDFDKIAGKLDALKTFGKQAGFIGRAGELLAGGKKMPVNFTSGTKVVRPGNVSWGAKVQSAGAIPMGTEALKSYGARGVAGAGLLGAGVLGAKAMSPNNNGQQPLPPPIKTAFALAPSSLLQGAGSLMAKSPRVGGAVIGGAAGLAGNALSGEDHALGSTLAGAAMGGLAGKKLLANNATRNPLFGKSFGTGVRNELKAGINAKQNLANSLKVPTKVNMSATEQAAANLKAPTPMNSQMTPRNVPINTNKVEPYAVNTKGPVAKLPTQQSEQLINEKAKSNMNQQVSQAYKPTRSSVPMPSNVVMGSRPQHVMNLRS